MDIVRRFGSIIGIVVGICTILSFMYAYDSRYSKAADVQKLQVSIQQLNKRLEMKIQSDRLYNIQRRIWMLKDRYKTEEEMPSEVKHEYRELLKEKEEIKRELEKLR